MNPKTIRAENRKKILHLLIRNRTATILEISQKLEISVPTVTKNIKQLVAEGIAEEAGYSASAVGRRPRVIKFLPDAYYCVGVEFSPNFVRIVLTNLDSKIRADRSLKHPDFQDLDGLMMTIRHEVDTMLLEKEIPLSSVLGIGFSLPATVNEETRFMGIAPNLGIQHVDFAQYEPVFSRPLFIENAANAAAMAELRLGIAKTMRNLVYLSVLSQGIGAGIVVHGELYKGKNDRAGDFGHIPIASRGRPCACGQKDCWEAYASANALITGYAEKTGQSLDGLDGFFALLQQRDPAAVEVFDEYLDYLAIGIRNIILIQDPHYVVIGGVISSFEEFFLKPLHEKVFIDNNFYTSDDLKVIWSTLKQDGYILGASLLPLDKIFSLDE